MALEIGGDARVEELVLWHDDKGAPLPEEKQDEATGRVVVTIRELDGGDAKAITDAMIEIGRKAKGKVKMGTMDMIRATRAVVNIEGLVLKVSPGAEPEPVKTLTPATYGKCPKWFVDALKTKIAEMEGDLEESIPEGE